jgi:flagella basal body P-ring formation protein FlgA
MSAGDAFSLRNLDEPKAVARNQEVILLIKSGDISVSAKARMMDDGRKGQMVDVINVANKKRLRARVIDENTVEAVTF